MLALGGRGPPHGLIQRAQPPSVDAVSGISHRELEAPGTDRERRDLHKPGVGELDRVGRQVEQHARERALVPGPPLRYRMHQADLETLLLRDGEDHAPDRPEHLRDLGQPVCDGRNRRRRGGPIQPFGGTRSHGVAALWAVASAVTASIGSVTASEASPAAAGSRSTTQPAVGLRCRPWRSISRYSVVRSTPAIRAALDMLPLARLTSHVRYWRSNWAITRSRAA